jgi:adenosylmethionine-8-amino-7-oxononanoate aminotransferase
MGKRMLDGLNALRKHAIVGDVRGLGLMCAVELVKDQRTKEPFAGFEAGTKLLNDTLYEAGMITRVAGNFIFLAPPLTVTAEEVDEMVGLVGSSIAHVESELRLT